MRGNRPLALGGVLVPGLVVCLVGFCLVLGLLVFFSPSSCSVSFPFNDDLGTPPTRRPYSWKKKPHNWQLSLPFSNKARSSCPEKMATACVECFWNLYSSCIALCSDCTVRSASARPCPLRGQSSLGYFALQHFSHGDPHQESGDHPLSLWVRELLPS